MDMVDYLDQREVWISREGLPQPIAEMERSWRINASRWLVRNAAPIWQAYREACLRREIVADSRAGTGVDQRSTRDLVATLAAISKPDEWVKGTELYAALVEDDDPFEAAPPVPAPLYLVR